MAADRELNARERKRVYMHSTIFDNGGPTSKSIYTQNQQHDLYKQMGDSLKPRGAPNMDLPRPGDIQATQNAGHGVVIPSTVGVDRGGSPNPLPSFPKGSTPRASGQQVLVTDGDPMPVTKAGYKVEAIPQEFWQTNVNLQWHDPRNEMSRQNKNRNQEMGAQELKLQELSSEIFGKARLKNCSTNNPGADLLAAEADYLQTDSSLNPNARQERLNQNGQSPSTAYNRFTSNLADSNLSTMEKAGGEYPPPMPREEDPSTVPRRRQEKNFSDLLGYQMGERRDIKVREEITGTGVCSFLDSRAETAARNKQHWRPGQSDVQGTDLRERPHVDTLRKEAERDSRVFDEPAQHLRKPRANTEYVQVTGDERVCFDTRELMQAESELARRGRLKDFDSQQSPQDRKWESLGSQQVRRGIGGEWDPADPQYSPRGGQARSNRLTDPPKISEFRGGGYGESRPMTAGESSRPMTAKDRKLATLQSSIFG